MKRRRSAAAVWFLSLVALVLSAGRTGAQSTLRISELMARNRETLLDGDGETSDWLEVENPGTSPVPLGGWFLTDSPGERRWSFPDVTIEPGGHLIVFASGKDRRDAGSELHTSFQLDAEGEYLALLDPEGRIVHAYSPEYPEQRTDISYGIGERREVDHLVPPGSSVRILVPSGDSLGSSWTGGNEPFDDGVWRRGVSGIGYVRSVPGFAVRNHLATITVDSLSTAERVIVDPDLQFDVFTENAGIIDYLGTNGDGHYPRNRPFPGASPGDNVDNFVVEAEATVRIPEAGTWTFGVRSDDGFGLDLEGEGGSFRIEHPAPRGPGDTLGVFDVPAPGDYRLRLVFYERGGGSMLELFAARGSFSSWSTAFRLVGDTAAGGLETHAEVVASGTSLGLLDVIETDVESAVHGVNASIYVRMPFLLDDPSSLDSLTLRMRYDDGFVAYLNGAEVVRRNAPESLAFDSRAVEDRPAALALLREDINLSGRRDLLRAGTNVLAFHALNDHRESPDFLLAAELAEITRLSMREGFFVEPTPGEANGETFAGVVADTRFDPDRGFYDAPFEVTITTATPEAEIRYTLDGTEPGPGSGTIYEGPIPIARTTTLRAAAFQDGFLPTNADTHTYLFLQDIVLQDFQATLDRGFPASWGGTSPDYGLDPDVVGQSGEDLYGGKYAASIRDDLLSIPTLSIVMDIDDMFGPSGIYTNSTRRGVAWERRCSAELIFPDGTEGFQASAGIRVHGGAFRRHGLTRKHSLRLLFKAIHGPTKLRYPLFGEDAADEFDTIVLRANSNDGWQWDAAGSSPLYVRDSFGRETVLDMGGVASHETFVHLYINGVYWGLYNPVERPDDAFSATYFGGDKEDWDAISNNQVSNGNREAWDTMLAMAEAGLASDADYEAIQGNFPDGTDDPRREDLLDVENLIDYMITNIWVGNTDWPHKNYWVGRNRVAASAESPETTGFKFYMWDSEWSMGIRSNLGTDRTGVSNGVATPYGAARANAEFRLRFADRLHGYFSRGGALHVDPAHPDWDPEQPGRNVPAARFVELVETIDRAIVAESARWGDQHVAVPYTRDEHWAVERDELLRDYFPRRSAVILQQLRAAGLYPPVDAPSFNRHGGRIEPGFVLSMRAPAGTVYYTLDGSDPRLRGGELSPLAFVAGSAMQETVLRSGAAVRYLVPQDGRLGTEWTLPDFDDSSWSEGATGIGYERSSGYEGEIATDVETLMYDIAGTIYLRAPFTVTDPAAVSFLTLRMKYDDGFVAYLNGVEVASRNAPDSPAWDSTAAANHSDGAAVVFEPIDMTAAAGALRRGTNVLAIHGLNVSTTSSDLLLVPEIDVAVTAGEGLVLEGTTVVRARALEGGEWSALTEATFVVDETLPLRITEIMYHPEDPPPEAPFLADDLEFLELRNVGAETVDLAGVRISGGVEFDFTASAVTSLGAGEIALVVENEAAFAMAYDTAGMLIAGEYAGRLSNGGEVLGLFGPLDETLLLFRYSDEWHPETDGDGFSLVAVDELADPLTWGERASWRPSARPGGSPGREDIIGPGGLQRPGDSNQDGRLDISDAISLLLRLFGKTPLAPPCDGDLGSAANLAVLDVTGNGRFDITDPVALLGYLFRNGAPPALGARCVAVEGCSTVCR